MTNLLKNLLFGLGLVVILFLGYQVFFTQPSPGASDGLGQAQKQTQDLLIRLQSIRNLKIDNALFSDPRFASLLDLRQQLSDVPVGRGNPFAPVQ